MVRSKSRGKTQTHSRDGSRNRRRKTRSRTRSRSRLRSVVRDERSRRHSRVRSRDRSRSRSRKSVREYSRVHHHSRSSGERSRSHTRRHTRRKYRRRSRSPSRRRSRSSSRSRSRSASRRRSRSVHDRRKTLEKDKNEVSLRRNRSVTRRSSGRARHRRSLAPRTPSPLPPRDVRTPSNNNLPKLCNPSQTSVRDGSTEPSRHSTVQGSEASTLAQALMEAIRSAQPMKSQSYFISNFDPSIHNIEVWCAEVDRARVSNEWSDQECLSRVGSCLKGDAKVWLNEWVTNDRTWSNFKREFKSLCPHQLDYANILLDTMNTTSDKFATYAEYARRTLLRLKMIQGLSDELRTLIVIRGIDSPQVRAAASNAKLSVENLVSFLSIYVKPTRIKHDNRSSTTEKRPHFQKRNLNTDIKCYLCDQRGHTRRACPKARKSNNPPKSVPPTHPPSTKLNNACSFCKKPGHDDSTCFLKARLESHPQQSRVNFCSEYPPEFMKTNDITTAVVNGVPVDVLIDSGAIGVSLVSSDLLKYLSCQPKHRAP